MEIWAETIAEAHEKVVKVIYQDGEEVITEDGEITIEWAPNDPVVIHVRSPFKQPMVSDVCRFGEQMMDAYVEQLLELHPPSETSATYYYSNRLFDYPTLECDTDDLCGKEYYYLGDGCGDGTNQIYWSIIRRLSMNPNSRRAMAITWVPDIDMYSNEPPCLQLIQGFIRDNKFHMTCYFRSNDMLSAWGANAYGLAHLMEFVVEKINEYVERPVTIGTLTTISSSAHIYWKRDKYELDQFRRKLNV